MAVSYRWDSPKSANEVLSAMFSMTDYKTRLYPIAFTPKQASNGDVIFKLRYHPILGNRFSYEPPMLKGTIRNTPKGCIISGEEKKVMASISNAIKIGFILLCYIIGIVALFGFIDSGLLFSVVFLLQGLILTCPFVYTYKESGSLKMQKKMMEIMEAAAGVNHQMIS